MFSAFGAYFWAQNLIYNDRFIDLLQRFLRKILFTILTFVDFFLVFELIIEALDHFLEFGNIWHVCFY